MYCGMCVYVCVCVCVCVRVRVCVCVCVVDESLVRRGVEVRELNKKKIRFEIRVHVHNKDGRDGLVPACAHN